MSQNYSSLHYLRLLDVVQQIQSGALSAVDVTQALLDRIARVE